MASWETGGLLGESACVCVCFCVCVGLAPATRTGQRANYSRHRNSNTRTSRVRRMDPSAGMASPGPEALLRPLLCTGRRVGAALLRTALCCTGVLDCAVPTVRRRLASWETGGLLGCVVPTALLRTGRRVGAAGPADSTPCLAVGSRMRGVVAVWHRTRTPCSPLRHTRFAQLSLHSRHVE